MPSQYYTEESLKQSRISYSFGEDNLPKINDLCKKGQILFFGCNSLACEIIKNLFLSGLHNIVIACDGKQITEDDLSGNFFANRSDIGITHSTVITREYPADIIQLEDATENLKDFNLVINVKGIFTEESIQLADKCHQLNIPYIASKEYGLVGMVYQDCGNDYRLKSSVPHEKLSQCIADGIFTSCNTQKFYFSKRSKQEEIYTAKFYSMYCIEQFEEKFKRLPNRNDITIIEEMIQNIKEKNPLNFPFSVENIHDFVMKASIQSSIVFSPVITHIGGLVSQEALKTITKVHVPLSQWYFADHTDVLDAIPGFPFEEIEYSPNIHVIERVLGSKYFQGLRNQHIVLVGCGALGCELIKIFSLLGVKKVSVIDPDRISSSNTTRQFLFKENHVSMFKAEVAAEIIKQHNSDIVIDVYTLAISDSTLRKSFPDAFWNTVDVIYSAVDSFRARNFLSFLSRWFNIPMLNSGTTGFKCSASVHIPSITAPFSAEDTEGIERQKQLCTGRKYPYKAWHCIFSASGEFTNYIDSYSNKIKRNYIPDDGLGSIYKNLSENCSDENFSLLADAILKEIFISKMESLIEENPKDSIDKHGNLFWEDETRVYPNILDFDDENIQDLILEAKNSIINVLKTIFISPGNIQPCVFEKDDPIHMEMVYCLSRLYWKTFNFEELTPLNTHKEVGNIIPALLTSTSIAAGCQAIEGLKLANFCNIVSNVSFKDYVFDARYGIFGNSNCLNSELDTLSIPIIEINEPEYSVKQVIEYIEKHLNVCECIEIFLESEGEEYLLNDDDNAKMQDILQDPKFLIRGSSSYAKLEVCLPDSEKDYWLKFPITVSQ